MHRMKTVGAVMPMTLLAAMVVSGCAVDYNVTKVDGFRRVMSEPGIYYMLPRSELTVALPIDIIETTTPRYYGIFDTCVAECGAAGALNKCKPPEKSATDVDYAARRPTVESQAVPDPNRLYRLALDFTYFNGADHTVSLSEDGILTSADSTITNHTVELALDTLSKIGGVVPTAMTGVPLSLDVTQRSAAAAPKTKAGICKEVNAFKKTLDDYPSDIENLSTERRELFVRVAAKADTKALELLESDFVARRTAFDKAYKAAVNAAKKTKKKATVTLKTALIPRDFEGGIHTHSAVVDQLK